MNYSQGTLGLDGLPLEMNYKEYRQEKSEKSKEYQDFICRWFAQNYGLVMSVFSSRKYQKEIGESIQGFEIKYDMLFEETGNLYIECGEKAMPRPGEYYPSGINANDNSWLYFIGNYHTLYIFSKKQLRIIRDRKLYKCFVLNNKTKTSEGYLLTIEQADKFCIEKINFDNA